jgi:hypothetical protein
MPSRFAHVYRSRSYLLQRAVLLASGAPCHEPGCTERPVVADHVPALSRHRHVEGSGCCRLEPQCARHSAQQGARLRNEAAAVARAANGTPVVAEPDGFGVDHPVWNVGWLQDLLDVPADASWPRVMSAPSPRAVGSYGAEFVRFAGERMNGSLRWWQQLVAARLLEHDEAGRLVWETALLSTARQVGKSILLRELLCWRMLQADRFGGPQVVLHTAKDRQVASEIQREVRLWAKSRDEFRVTSAHGFELVERSDGSRWMILAKGAVYGRSAAMAAVDEGWAVRATEVEDGLIPTLVEPASSQLVIVSTANRNATSLVLNRRRAALELLDDPGAGDLLIEWSAPPGCDITDPAMWRMASPHWTAKREQMIQAAVGRALAGDTADGDEDPQMAVKTQWLNLWVEQQRVSVRGERLLADGVWSGLATGEDTAGRSFTVAIEDWFGSGGSVAVAGDLPDGRWQLAGWECASRADAVQRAHDLLDLLAGCRVRLVAGATMAADPDIADLGVVTVTPGTGALTRSALSLFRELAAEGRVAWDPGDGQALARAVERARVVERQTGLTLVGGDRTDLLKASVWALQAQTKPPRVPAIY